MPRLRRSALGLARLARLVIGLARGAAQATRADLARARVALQPAPVRSRRSRRRLPRARRRTRRMPAAIVLARAHLERYRERADPSDLSAAREALGAVRAAGPRPARSARVPARRSASRCFSRTTSAPPPRCSRAGSTRRGRAIRRCATRCSTGGAAPSSGRPASPTRDSRRGAFSPARRPMRDELAPQPRRRRRPATGRSSALRGAGEPMRAWDAAVAGWVRARLIGERSAALRADLDQLVLHGIIPDRVRHLPRPTSAPPSRSSRRTGNWSRRSGNRSFK